MCREGKRSCLIGGESLPFRCHSNRGGTAAGLERDPLSIFFLHLHTDLSNILDQIQHSVFGPPPLASEICFDDTSDPTGRFSNMTRPVCHGHRTRSVLVVCTGRPRRSHQQRHLTHKENHEIVIPLAFYERHFHPVPFHF